MIKNSILKKSKTTLDGSVGSDYVSHTNNYSLDDKELTRSSLISGSKNVRFEEAVDSQSEEYFDFGSSQRVSPSSSSRNNYYKNKSMPFKEFNLFDNFNLRLEYDHTDSTQSSSQTTSGSHSQGSYSARRAAYSSILPNRSLKGSARSSSLALRQSNNRTPTATATSIRITPLINVASLKKPYSANVLGHSGPTSIMKSSSFQSNSDLIGRQLLKSDNMKSSMPVSSAKPNSKPADQNVKLRSTKSAVSSYSGSNKRVVAGNDDLVSDSNLALYKYLLSSGGGQQQSSKSVVKSHYAHFNNDMRPSLIRNQTKKMSLMENS